MKSSVMPMYGTPDAPKDKPRDISGSTNAPVKYASEAWTGEKNSTEVVNRGYITQEDLCDARCESSRENQRYSRQNVVAA